MVVTSKKQRDPNRKTVGSQYLAAGKNDQNVVVGDMTRELMKSFTDDLNETIASNPYEGEEFYITVYEKKDLQMKSAIIRRLYTSKYRPYPEDDTIVFHVNPKNQRVKFCWCLPHSTEMDNILMMCVNYDKEFISDILAWKDPDYNKCLKHFGFQRIGKAIVPSKENRDKPLNFSETAITI